MGTNIDIDDRLMRQAHTQQGRTNKARRGRRGVASSDPDQRPANIRRLRGKVAWLALM